MQPSVSKHLVIRLSSDSGIDNVFRFETCGPDAGRQ
jgi:hypothetical protein